MRIEIDARGANKALKWIVIIGIAILLIVLGKKVTPVDVDGNLLFLSPRVAEIASYQRQVQKWVTLLGEINTEMQDLLEGNSYDIFQQDSAFQEINREVNSLVTAIDSTSAPDSLVGLRDLMVEVTSTYANAAYSLGQWISEPSEVTYQTAYESLSNATSQLERVYENPWVVIEKNTDELTSTGTRR